MRELFITRDHKLNWSFLLPTSIASAFIYAISMISVFNKFYEHNEAMLVGTLLSIVANFLRPIVWAWMLMLSSGGSKLKDFAMASVGLILFNALWFGLRILSAGSSELPQLTSPENIVQIIQMIAYPVVLVAFCEWFYERLNNKLVLFYIGLTMAGITSSLLFHVQYNSYSSVSGSLLQIAANYSIDYFFALILIRLFRLPLPVVLDSLQQEKLNLNTFLQEQIKANEPPAEILNKAQTQFSNLTFSQIAKSFTGAADPDQYAYYKSANMILIIVNLVGIVFGLIVSGPNQLSMPLTFFGDHIRVDDLFRLLISIVALGVIIVKIKLTADMVVYRAYTYKIMIWLGSLGILTNIYDLTRGNVFLPMLTFTFDIIFIGLALNISGNLFPRYKLMKTNYEPRDFASQEQ